MIEINLNEYVLRFKRKADGKILKGRRTSSVDYVLFDEEKNEKLHRSYYFLKKEFVSCSDNFERKKALFNVRVC
jgi:hypothetical protein